MGRVHGRDYGHGVSCVQNVAGQVHTLDSNDIKIGRTRKADLVLVLDIHKGQTESLRE